MTDDSKNRFRDVMNAARNREQLPPQPPASISPAPAAQQVQPQAQPGPAKRGRPVNGKRNNPEYEQVGAYIPKELYRKVKIRLLELEPEGQFSDLVEFLLTRWVQGAYKRD